MTDTNNSTSSWTARDLADALGAFGRANIRNVPTSDIQAESDRKSAEHARLVDTPLPDGWLELCMDAGFPGLPADMTVEEAHRRIRAIVNTVLPLHEQLVRKEIAAAIYDADDACGAPVCECCGMQRNASVAIAHGAGR